MHRLNITEYSYPSENMKIYHGRTILKPDYTFANGDEYFYKLMGNNSCYAMTELIPSEDVGEFKDMLSKLDLGNQKALILMRVHDNAYRYLYAEFSKNEREGYVNMEFCDFMSVKDKYLRYHDQIQKYRQFMSMTNEVYFDYSYSTEILSIYRYVMRNSIPIVKENIHEAYKKVEAGETFFNKEDFRLLYDLVLKKTDRFEERIRVTLDDIEKDYICKGCIITTERGEDWAMGVLIPLDVNSDSRTAYYLSEAALDVGTGVLNKRAIYDYTTDQITDHRLSGKAMYMAILDIDDFKNINDTYGHLYGDKVLSKVSNCIKNTIGSRGMVGRYGGDEFVVCFDKIFTEESLRLVIKTICKHIQWEFLEEYEGSTVTTSWGVSRYPDDGTSYQELFVKADKGLYIAKRKGKNRYIIYDEKKHGNIANEKETEEHASRAIALNEEQKSLAVSDMVKKLYAEGMLAVKDVLEQMRIYFDIDGIAVYRGSDMARVMSAGTYTEPIMKLTAMQNPEYIALFDDRGVYMESTISRLDTTFQRVHEMYVKQKNGKFIQYMSMVDGKPMAVVAFDFFNRSPKLGAPDQHMMMMIGRLLADIVAREDVN